MTEANSSCRHLPPHNFIPAGFVRCAQLASEPPFIVKPTSATGAKARGMSYERKVQSWLLELFHDSYLPSPWFSFINDRSPKLRFCQPDGLLFDPWRGICTLVEVKLKHTPLAWWQMRQLYAPVVQAALGAKWTIHTVEVVRWFDPSVATPQRPRLRSRILDAAAGEFAVHIHA